jgi:hypothetical protein
MNGNEEEQRATVTTRKKVMTFIDGDMYSMKQNSSSLFPPSGLWGDEVVLEDD